MQMPFLETLGDSRYPEVAYHDSLETVKAHLNALIQRIATAREDTVTVRNLQARRLYETTMEVLKDLVAAYELHERRSGLDA